ncbi:LOW QUALITY PROTEIN: branched-chain-amino-acid aminotransferase, cytosolic [Spinachia spinachia]
MTFDLSRRPLTWLSSRPPLQRRNRARRPLGNVFTDHMLTIECSESEGWQAPIIKPFGNLSLHPACSSLHYGLFEWLKAFGGDNTAKRACLPAFDQSEFLECIRRLVHIDQDWVPQSDLASLYIRPTFLGTEQSLGLKKAASALLYVILFGVGTYFNSETECLSLWGDPKYTRAWRGRTGNYKMGGNYGCSLFAQCGEKDHGGQQVLWLYGEDHQITEAGTMNIFLHWINEDGEEELATPPLDGIILPGVTRQSILELTRKWVRWTKTIEVKIQLCSALKQLRVKEVFGPGTACMICPIGWIVYLIQSTSFLLCTQLENIFWQMIILFSRRLILIPTQT